MCVWYSILNIQYYVDLFFDSSTSMNFDTFRWKNNVERFLCNLYNLEQHKRFGFSSHMANASLITHTDAACSVLKFGQCLHLHTYFVHKSSKGYVVSNYRYSQDRLLLHRSTLGYEPKSNVLAHLIYYLFTIYNQFSLLWNVQRMNWM